MKNSILIYLFSLTICGVTFSQATYNCNRGTQEKFLEVNNVRALITNKNLLWYDTDNELMEALYYQVPKHTAADTLPPKNIFFSGAVWMGGFGANGQLKVAANSYGNDGFDFFPGPIEDEATNLQVCNAWDELFEVSSSEIDAFLNDGTISVNLLRYPAKNNPHLINEIGASLPENENYFPFYDVNSDAIYNPNDGDYPNISGDQSIHWILNDIGNIHEETQGQALGVEIKCTAYAYNIPSLDTITFYRFEVTNKSYEKLNEYIFGFWADPCLGKFDDDFVGVDTTTNTAYVYNGDADDNDVGGYGTNIPIAGITLLDAPYETENDESKLHSFIYYTGDFTFASNPENFLHYYDYLRSRWKNGQHLTYGADGTNPSNAPADFMFPSNPEDQSLEAWSECKVGNTPADRRFIFSAKPITLERNQTVKYEFAVVSTFDTNYPCTDISGLQAKVAAVQSYYDININPQILATDVKGNNTLQNSIQIFPNPIKDFIQIESSFQFEKADIYSIAGKKVLSDLTVLNNTIELDGLNLKQGNYLLYLIDHEKRIVCKKVNFE